ncbi:ABC transporter ATP-binding protein [Luteibacter yeojuensis]|nr:ATP-binding cassette domain-containing protein [Luteibacter yeojuensis]
MGTGLHIESLRGPHVGPLSFAVARGECIAVMGASGAGKTQLLRLVADLDPGEGRASLDGVPRDAIPAPAWRHKVMFVPAVSGWWAATVAEHFDEAVRDDALSLCTAMRLPAGIMARDLTGLSTGERQRLALVRAIVRKPGVLLLDEPTSGLDAETAEAVEACLGELRASHGVAMVWVTHDASQAARVAGKVYRIIGGALVPA